MAGRTFDVTLHLLDHQLVDTDGRLAGKVDDVEIRVEADGTATVVALLCGPGVLAQRLGHTVYGRWRERLEDALEGDAPRSTRIPFSAVREVGTGIRLNRAASALASHGSERWVRDHVISHIPGARSGE